MPVQINVTIKGDKATIEKFSKLGTDLNNFYAAMQVIGKEVSSYYANQVYASQGGAIGQRWQSLTPGYAMRKAVQYPGRPMLVRTGAMQKSFTYRPEAKQVSITNPTPYFKYHQSSAPRTKMPYRPSMAINSYVKTLVKQVIYDDVTAKLRRAGL